MTHPAAYTRRTFLRDALALAVGTSSAAAFANPPLRLIALGQAAIQHDLRQQDYPEFRRLAAILKRADICFSDLETAIAGPGAGAPTRNSDFIKVADPAVLDCLKDWSINMLALSNNHSWDIDTGGILATLEAVRMRGFAYAGTGANIAAAVAPGYRDTPAGRVALISMASGAIREGAAATEERAGVNEARLTPERQIHEDDAARNIASIREASRNAQYVICYQHDHYWERDFRITPGWKRAWARRCIDAGASMFVSHGAPLLHGIEIYRGKPLFYNLGSFVFHSKTPIGYYLPEVWESVIADCVFLDGRFVSVDLIPLELNERGMSPETQYATRGRPTIARGADAQRILDRVQKLSAVWGTDLRKNGDSARLVVEGF